MKRTGRNKKIRRYRLSVRIACLAVLTSVFSIAFIEILHYNTRRITMEYDRVVEKDYDTVELMSNISGSMYRHQTLVYHHIMEKNVSEKLKLRQTADHLANEIRNTLVVLEENMRGTSYEKSFHEFYSQVNSYLRNADITLDFSEDGDIETANYYMDTTMSDIRNKVNARIIKLNRVVQEDMENTKEELREESTMLRNISFAVIIILVVMTVFSVAFCIRIAGEMISRDMLTGVANFDRLVTIGERYGRRKRLTGYTGIAISIKDFKFINQQHGSLIGDTVLKKYATCLADGLKRGEIIARNGGDNFLALIEKDRSGSFMERIEKMRIDIGERMSLMITSRLGVYEIEEGDSIRDVINAVLIAIGDARVAGAANIVWFKEESRKEMIRHQEILNDYRTAMREEDFVVYYQPKVDLRTKRLCGCEALVRWVRDDKIIPPGSFIPVLEEDGKIQELDFYVFRHVCRDLKDWIDRGIEPVRISSNFSRLHLHNERFVPAIRQVIDAFDVDTCYLEAELTETFSTDDYETLRDFVAQMKEEGIVVSMDDFGTGYSSLSLLRDIDLDVIKLDRTFLKNIEEGDETEERLVENIIHMIHDLNRDVICEGVETKKQAEFLQKAGCNKVQGFLFDRPLPHDEFEKRLMEPVYKM